MDSTAPADFTLGILLAADKVERNGPMENKFRRQNQEELLMDFMGTKGRKNNSKAFCQTLIYYRNRSFGFKYQCT